MSLFSKESLKRFEALLGLKYTEIYRSLCMGNKADRLNVSAHWNRWLKKVGGRLLRGKPKKLKSGREVTETNEVFFELVDILNHDNEALSGSVMVRNPDRLGQWIIFPRDVIDRAMVLGLP